MRPSMLMPGAALLALLIVGCGSTKAPATQPTAPAATWPPPAAPYPPPAAQPLPPAAQTTAPAAQSTPPATTPAAAAAGQISFCGMDLAPDVRQVECHDHELTDLSPLRALTRVEQMNLSDTKVRDLGPLSGLTQLRTLNLSRTNVSDLRPLRGLSHLDTLILATVPVDKLAKDEIDLDDSLDLGPVASLPALRELDLAYSLVVDLSPLTRSKSLTWIRVAGTHTDTYNVGKVRRALPDCQVLFESFE